MLDERKGCRTRLPGFERKQELRAQPTVGNAETSLEQHRDKAFRPKGDVGAVTNGHKVAVS